MRWLTSTMDDFGGVISSAVCTRVPRLLGPTRAKNPSVPSHLSQVHCFHEKSR